MHVVAEFITVSITLSIALFWITWYGADILRFEPNFARYSLTLGVLKFGSSPDYKNLISPLLGVTVSLT